MTNQEFINRYCDIFRVDSIYRADYLTRDLYVAITRSAYGKAGTAILELTGSPPRACIVVDLYAANNRGTGATIIHNWRRLTGHRRDQVHKLVMEYLPHEKSCFAEKSRAQFYIPPEE